MGGRSVDGRQWRATIAAAQNGDRRALDELVEGWLPLVYNIVGRALNGHADVDDVVQDTMLRAVHGLGSLRDPEAFRSWLVAIAMRQIRDRARRRTADALPDDDHGAPDFAELTVLRLQLEGQRREVAEAVRWLADEDRELLSLWWLEVAGELTRRELAAAVGISRQHAAVRVQRMKARLETARGIVRALGSSCPDLREVTDDWDGRPDSVWRKRLARHIRGCARCSGGREDAVPAERLLVGIALVPLPAGFTLATVLGGGKTAAAAATVSATASVTAPVGWSAKVLGALAKPAVAVTAGAAIAAGGAYVVTQAPDEPAPRTAPPTTASTARPPSSAPPASPAPSPSHPEEQLYGTVVDTADRAPAATVRPAALPRRADGTVTLTGAPPTGLTHRGEEVTFTGRGYVRVRWQVLPGQRPGALVMPTWTGLRGRLFHVASGGGRRLDDVQPGSADGTTWMGGPATGTTVLPAGAQQMWQNEYFWLDGSVTLHQNERGADYNLFAQASSWDQVAEDVATPPDAGAGVVRYGLVRDTGEDTAPVPQYLTRARPADPATVPRQSEVTPPPR
ncbi:sigma-70 family RNA polymerase sigma factor [Streptomyces sp. NPDC019937]|uniref:RNA polymerase sigma factor n=1 Tax=Streptomyces sp. NPDC019937 TaxID=3154787 RepID=UPI0033EA3AA0